LTTAEVEPATPDPLDVKLEKISNDASDFSNLDHESHELTAKSG